jgi:calcineurin-like phosphoesterase
MEREPSLARFLTGTPAKLEPASANPRLNGVLVSADEKTGRATSVTRLSYSEQDLATLAATAKTESRVSNPESPLASQTK